MRIPILLSLAAFAAALPAHATPSIAARDEQAAARLLAGKTAGPPVSCVSLPRLGASTIAGGKIYYRATGALVYVNDPGPGCRLRRDSIIVTRTPSTQLCSGDIFEVREHGDPVGGGSCTLGSFTPWRNDTKAGD